jgi:hypothetical protein
MWPFKKRYSPWALYASDQIMIREQFNPLWGMGMISRRVLVDVYVRHNKKTNLPEYKYVEKPFLK